MTIFSTLKREAHAHNLSFLLIGGHAVASHGYGRTTIDVDLLVRKSDRDKWMDLAGRLGFHLFHDGGSFLQFSAADDLRWPLDLMLVNDETFDGMHDEAREVSIGSTELKIPSLRHLLALKLHALKGSPNHRTLKDMQDVTSLVEINGLDVSDPEFQALVVKYGSDELYRKIIELRRE